MKRLRHVIDDLNTMLFNPVGLNILWPGDVAFLYVGQFAAYPKLELTPHFCRFEQLEIEYYVRPILPTPSLRSMRLTLVCAVVLVRYSDIPCLNSGEMIVLVANMPKESRRRRNRQPGSCDRRK